MSRKAAIVIVAIIGFVISIPLLFAASFKTYSFEIDYGRVKETVMGNRIDTSNYVDPETKNNLDLVTWAEEAYKKKWGYVCGTFGSILTEDFLRVKIGQYPNQVAKYEDFIRENYVNRRTCDCIGLIKGYGWLNSETGAVIYGSNDMPDISEDAMYEVATEKGTIDTMPDIPGLAVWHEGHIGIYVGDGYSIHAANTKAGVVKTKVEYSGWTHWLKIPYIEYLETEGLDGETNSDISS